MSIIKKYITASLVSDSEDDIDIDNNHNTFKSSKYSNSNDKVNTENEVKI